MQTVQSYATPKSAKAAAKRAGVLAPVLTTLPDGRVQWSAPAPVKPAAKPKAVAKAPAPAKPAREAVNGIKRPKAGGLCAAVWGYLDMNGNCDLATIKQVAAEQGWNVSNASIELYAWRKFSGFAGRFTAAA